MHRGQEGDLSLLQRESEHQRVPQTSLGEGQPHVRPVPRLDPLPHSLAAPHPPLRAGNQPYSRSRVSLTEVP